MPDKDSSMVNQYDLPEVIPPRSVVRLVRADRSTPHWRDKIGNRYRVGYYSPRHGMEEINLLDEEGCFFDAVDRRHLTEYFRVERLSRETDTFGATRRPMGPLRRRGVRHDLRTRVRQERSNVRLPTQWPAKIIDRFKWPIRSHVQNLRPVLRRMECSPRKQPPFYFFLWPDKMRFNSFEGDLEALLKFLEKSLAKQRDALRDAVNKVDIADWQILIIRSVRDRKLIWLATHRVGFVTCGKSDIWPEYAIQRIDHEQYLVWRWKP